jgi:inhibitor of cysteine peptidase
MTTKVWADGKAIEWNAQGLRLAAVAVAVLVSVGVLLPGCMRHSEKLKAKMLRIDENYSGRTVKLATGDALEISLAENPTTGYRWHFLEAVPSTCLLVKDAYKPSSAGVVGQGGIHHWHFKAAEPGACRIELEYRRSWEKSTPPGRTFRIRVEVGKDAQGRDPSRPSE